MLEDKPGRWDGDLSSTCGQPCVGIAGANAVPQPVLKSIAVGAGAFLFAPWANSYMENSL